MSGQKEGLWKYHLWDQLIQSGCSYVQKNSRAALNFNRHIQYNIYWKYKWTQGIHSPCQGESNLHTTGICQCRVIILHRRVMSKHDCRICNFVFHVSGCAAIIFIQVTGAPDWQQGGGGEEHTECTIACAQVYNIIHTIERLGWPKITNITYDLAPPTNIKSFSLLGISWAEPRVAAIKKFRFLGHLVALHITVKTHRSHQSSWGWCHQPWHRLGSQR